MSRFRLSKRTKENTDGGIVAVVKKAWPIGILLLAAILAGEQARSLTCRTDFLTGLSEPQSSEILTSSGVHASLRTNSVFDEASKDAFASILRTNATIVRRQFDGSRWNKATGGGLLKSDRALLGKIYGNAQSVFEYGLGESTYIANHVGVPVYAGIDSMVEWVDKTRNQVSPHFRFYFADVGKVEYFGRPEEPLLAKNLWQYQIAPLAAEPHPFDVYMVDGRWRVACVLISFLHASARGADPKDTIVLMHDCLPTNAERMENGRHYGVNDDILNLVDHSKGRLCVYKRNVDTTDAMLLERYKRYKYEVD